MSLYVLNARQALELKQRLDVWLESDRYTNSVFDLTTTLKAVVGEAESPPVDAYVDATDTWVLSPVLAARYSQTHEQQLNSERKPKEPPHWMRCQFVKSRVRCRKGEGHERHPNDSGHEEPR